MNAPGVRIASERDFAAIAVLFDAYRQFYGRAPELSLATRFIRDRMQKNESVILVAENSDKQLVGFCQLYPGFCSVLAAPIYTLYDLFVTPSARRTGAGRALLIGANELALKRGVARMDLSTAKTNVPAQSLYESLGWIRDQVFYAYNKSVK